MSQSKHTPGPWMVDPKFLSEVQTSDDKTVCSAWHQHADGATITVTGILACSLEESAANARLIAAAPDLLIALVWAMGKINPPNSVCTDEAHARYNFAVAAIAKAEGRSDA